MSNHGSDSSDFPGDVFSRFRYPDQDALGATGRFPLGKLIPEDEGELRFALAADPQTKTVILDFGKPVAWIALPREEVKQLTALLLEKLKELE